MKPVFYIIFLFSIGLNAQSLNELKKSISQLNNSLVEKDTVTLNLVLHKDVSVTHSNGFTESKSKMKQNTISSFIKYKKIEQNPEIEFQKINDRNYIVYRFIHVEGIYDIYDYEMNLRLMEVWTWEKKKWQLIGRQSLEID